jgi:hypothetical protein
MPEAAVHSSTPAATETAESLPIVAAPEPVSRGILLIDPDISLLYAEYLLLTNSNYYVTPAFSHREIFALRETKEVALAILSDSLGRQLLGAIAETVRRQWPLARILILGRAESVLEDHLYDEQIDHSLDPTQILDDLERLYKGSWNQRTNTLDWNTIRGAVCAGRSPLRESDPSKFAHAGLIENKQSHDIPADFRLRCDPLLCSKQAKPPSQSTSTITHK